MRHLRPSPSARDRCLAPCQLVPLSPRVIADQLRIQWLPRLAFCVMVLGIVVLWRNQISVPVSINGDSNPKLAGRLRVEITELVQRILYEEARA